MSKLKQFAFIPILFFLVGCNGNLLGANVPVPETPRQVLAQAEISYQGILATVDQLIDNGTITASSADAIAGTINTARLSMDAARAAVASNQPNADTFLLAANGVLDRLTQILIEKKRGT